MTQTKNVLLVFSQCSKALDTLNGEAGNVVSALAELYGLGVYGKKPQQQTEDQAPQKKKRASGAGRPRSAPASGTKSHQVLALMSDWTTAREVTNRSGLPFYNAAAIISNLVKRGYAECDRDSIPFRYRACQRSL